MFVLVLNRFFLEMKRNNMGSLFAKKANNFQNIAAHLLDSFFGGSHFVCTLYVTLSGIVGLLEVHGRFLDFCIF